MSIETNADLMRKMREKFVTGDFASGGGLLGTEQADRFIDRFTDLSVLLKKTSQRRVTNRAGEFYEIDSAGHATVAANAEGTEHTTETWGIVTATRGYTCKKIHSQFYLTWEDVHWTVEGTGFEDTVMSLWARQLSKDLEVLALHGEAGKYSPADTSYKKLVNIDDGWITLLLEDDNTNIVDVSDDGEPVTVDESVFAKALNAMPEEYAADPEIRWICSPRLISDYRRYFYSRTDVGGAALQGQMFNPEGIEFFNDQRGVPYMPFNLGTGGNETVLLLCNPKQLAYVVHREFTVYRNLLPRRDAWEMNGFGYVDFIVMNPKAVVLVKGLTKDTKYEPTP